MSTNTCPICADAWKRSAGDDFGGGRHDRHGSSDVWRDDARGACRWPAPSSAQNWPQRPVRFIVTLGPASGIDIGTRLLSDHLSRKWGQPVVVENKPGGDGIVAINAFVAANDHHVLLAAPSSSFTAHPYQHENLSYKPSDLQPIARVSNTVIVVAVPASLNVASLKDLVAMARREPGKLNWVGTTGAVDFFLPAF